MSTCTHSSINPIVQYDCRIHIKMLAQIHRNNYDECIIIKIRKSRQKQQQIETEILKTKKHTHTHIRTHHTRIG